MLYVHCIWLKNVVMTKYFLLLTVTLILKAYEAYKFHMQNYTKYKLLFLWLQITMFLRSMKLQKRSPSPTKQKEEPCQMRNLEHQRKMQR